MKNYYLTVQDTITGETVIVPVSEEIYLEYMRPKWRESKQRKRAHHCRLPNGKRCYEDCNTCKYAPTESFSYEKMLEEGIPKDEVNKRVMLPHTDGDIADQIYHDSLIANLFTLVDSLTGDEHVIVEDFMAKVTEAETAKKLGCCQKSVNNRKRKIFQKLKEILTNSSL